jgi:hypothetical protein
MVLPAVWLVTLWQFILMLTERWIVSKKPSLSAVFESYVLAEMSFALVEIEPYGGKFGRLEGEEGVIY